MTTPTDATALVDNVLIWSGEHRAWWRAASAGYCESAVGAGVYSREEAEHLTAHCGPEKRIAIRSVRDVLAEASEGCVGSFLLSLVAQGEADRERLCEWREPDGYHDDAWETTCGEAWTFLAGGVAENNVRFCHGCGGRVVAVPFVPAPDEDATPTEGPTHG